MAKAADHAASTTLVTVLVGAVVAGVLAALARLALDWRAERRELKAAVRVIVEDLMRMQHRLLEVELSGQAIAPRESWLLLEGWPQVRLTLARGLRSAEWENLRATVAHAELLLIRAERQDRSDPMWVVTGIKGRDHALAAVRASLSSLERRAQLYRQPWHQRALAACRVGRHRSGGR